MNRCMRVCGWVGVTGLLGTGISSAQSEGQAHVTARLYDMFAIAGQELSTAERTADAIFRDAGVTVRWRHCPRPERPVILSADPCDDMLQPTEVLVRLLTALPPLRPARARVLASRSADAQRHALDPLRGPHSSAGGTPAHQPRHVAGPHHGP
jgi:hypothetical protein